jgi:DNA adenine methylase
VEPFVGGGSVFLYLLRTKQIKKAIIADKDPLVHSFWKILFTQPDHLIQYINSIDVTIDNFKKYKLVLSNCRSHKTEELAKACLFLNRTSFSGLLTEKVGPLGGKFQTSEYKLPCRFIRATLVDRIKHISKYSRKVIVLNTEWRETIEYSIKWANQKKTLNRLLFYLDPPFYKKGNELYSAFFKDEEHRQLNNYLKHLKHNWILSYDNTSFIKNLYSSPDFAETNLKVPYSLNSHARRIEQELIISPLKLPKHKTQTYEI